MTDAREFGDEVERVARDYVGSQMALRMGDFAEAMIAHDVEPSTVVAVLVTYLIDGSHFIGSDAVDFKNELAMIA